MSQEQNNHGKTYNKSPRRINHKATKSKTNTGTTALERSVEQTTEGFKALLQLANFTLGPDATLNTEIHKNSVPAQTMHQSENLKVKLITIINKDEYLWLILLYARVNAGGPSQRHNVKPQPTGYLAVIESEARTAVVQLKSEA